uniref:Uncharacterized protein n=1 Tax=Tanacetum cinerariifolium TaxID=118510 RepID=A0A6L2MHK0_TANCI|nr:hypothetical protein [Tanacetum cinerariifolium]
MNKVKVLKLRRLKRVKSAQRIDTSDDTVMDDVSNQGRMITDMDEDVDVVLEEANMDEDADVVLEEAKDVAGDAKDDQDADVQDNADIQGRTIESEPAKLQEVVDIVTTAKIITEVVTAASTTITAADVPIPIATTATAPTLTTAPSRRTKRVVIRDPKGSTTTTSTIFTLKPNLRIKESEVSLELLSFGVEAAMGFEKKYAKCLMLLVKDLVFPSQVDAVD